MCVGAALHMRSACSVRVKIHFGGNRVFRPDQARAIERSVPEISELL